MDIARHVRDSGGFATTRELRRAGASEWMLTHAVRAGHVRRVRNGWYSTVDPGDARYIAVRVGGRLTGVSAFRQWGAWILPRTLPIHVAVPYNAARLRDVALVRLHYAQRATSVSRTEVSLHDALVRLLLDEPAEVVVPCIDWLLHTGRADLIDVHRAAADVPADRRAFVELADRASQSVLESVARVRLVQKGFHVLTQQRTGEVGSVDLLVEGSITLELDGRGYHEDSFEGDRRRDLVTTIEGKHVIRVSERMLREVWPGIVAAIEAGLRARHLGNSGSPTPSPPQRRQPHRAASRTS